MTRIFLPTLHLCMLGVFLYSCLPRILPTFISPADLTYKLLPAQAHKCMHVHVRMHVRVRVCQVFSLNLGLLSTLKTLISAEQILTTYLLLPDILLKSISMMLYLHCSPPPSCSHLWSLFIMPKQIQTFHSSRSWDPSIRCWCEADNHPIHFYVYLTQSRVCHCSLLRVIILNKSLAPVEQSNQRKAGHVTGYLKHNCLQPDIYHIYHHSL